MTEECELHVLNLGAGVQSTTLYLLSQQGYIQRFDAAVFADTQDEPGAEERRRGLPDPPESVYAHLDWLDTQNGAPIRTAFPGLGTKILSSLSSPKNAHKCTCGGNCLCHTGVQMAGVPCPPGCKNFGNHFDGCHRCDCEPGQGNKP